LLAFRLIIASDAGFVDLWQKRRTRARLLELPAIPNGAILRQVTALAADGF